ncbi:MAG TPA: hypothetical protein VFH25_04905 [Nitrososphaeraceae archaeon]|nr:hypothetical protein [Nitrososphaeraceae archaeon]
MRETKEKGARGEISLFSSPSIVLLIVFLSKWSSLLVREVQRRTSALELSNEEIRQHLDFVQKEVERFKRETQSK